MIHPKESKGKLRTESTGTRFLGEGSRLYESRGQCAHAPSGQRTLRLTIPG